MIELQEYRIHYQVVEFSDAGSINEAIWQQYLQVRDDPDLRRSHYFNGRYENIYVSTDDVPALQPVLRVGREQAARFLQKVEGGLSTGFWVNEIRPGDVTLPHHHAEDDELLSAVYYVRVPPHSGELILTQGAATTRIDPKQGMFVFFAPEVTHEVSTNNSSATRLSIGMNFGIRR